MAMHDRISALVVEAQQRIFRLAERDHGLSMKAIGLDSGIPYNTIRSYAGRGCEPVIMPVSAVLRLVGVIPDDLLSHLFDPVGRHLEETPTEDGDLDALGCEAAGFTAEYVEAKSDGNVTSIERNKLRARAARVCNLANRVARA